MVWSPEFNPDENLWSMIARRVYNDAKWQKLCSPITILEILEWRIMAWKWKNKSAHSSSLRDLLANPNINLFVIVYTLWMTVFQFYWIPCGSVKYITDIDALWWKMTAKGEQTWIIPALKSNTLHSRKYHRCVLLGINYPTFINIVTNLWKRIQCS